MKTRVPSISMLSLALLQPIAAIAQPEPWSGYWHMWPGGGAMWWLMPFIVLIAVTACAAMFLLRASGGRAGELTRPPADPTAPALQILNERFARGEIARQEYEERKRALLTIMTPGGQA